MERPDPEQQRRWLSSALPPIEQLVVQLAPPRPNDAWSLDHPYVAAPDMTTASLWANLPTFIEMGRRGVPPDQLAQRISLAPHELVEALVTSVLVDQFHIARTRNVVTPSPPPATHRRTRASVNSSTTSPSNSPTATTRSGSPP